jgi:hypothetical protein
MDSVVPLIPLMLDKERHLRLNASAMRSAELDLSRLWDKDISIYAALTTVPLRINDIGVLLYWALRHEDPRLTQEEVWTLMDHAPIAVIMQALTDAWTWAARAANPVAGDPDEDPPTAASIGQGSGPMAAPNSALQMTSSGP